MPIDEDKYPAESDRRRFVKGVVGSAALVGFGGTGAITVDSLTNPTGAGGGTVLSRVVENTGGPAPRGMPVIPIQFDDEGYLQGLFPEWEEVEEQGRTFQIAETEIGGVTYGAEWFQYCGVQSYAGLQPDADQDQYFRYTTNYEWHADMEGEKVHRSHFEEGDGCTGYEEWGNGIGDAGVGKPAAATWRSQDVGGKDTMPVQIIKSTNVEEMTANSDDAFVKEAAPDGFIANLNKCTHFCCVPGFKTQESSVKFGGENDIYCQCHQSVYDPFSVVEAQFTALPRPESD